MSIRIRFVFLMIALTVTSAAFGQNFTVRCQWGGTTPAVWPNSVNVISTPTVLNFRGTGSSSQIAFVSYETTSQLTSDGKGVLRVMDSHCNELARFPDPACPIPSTFPNAPSGFGTNPDLAPVSGLAAGDLDRDGIPEIVAVIGDGTNPHRQLAAFNLIGGCLVPRWVSADTLPANDFIATAAPAIVQLDRPGGTGLTVPWDHAEIIIDNKIYNSDGSRRFTAFSFQNYCGNVPCPRSRTAIAAKLPGHILPRIITGRGIYSSLGGLTWHMSFGPPVNIIPAMSNSGLTYPAVAELDPNSFGPEIVVVDTLQGPGTQRGTLWVLRATGATLASTPISGAKCGGPPMIGNADGVPGPEIGVATCDAYTLYKYNSNSHTIIPVWSKPISDPSGQTTSTLYNGPHGARIVYADQNNLYIFDGATGAIRQQITNGSATAFEGPVVTSFDTGLPTARCAMSRGSLVVAANDGAGGSIRGVRIFDDATGDIGDVGSCWSANAFHVTNITSGTGLIPQFEQPSWASTSPARNTYRVQAWP